MGEKGSGSFEHAKQYLKTFCVIFQKLKSGLCYQKSPGFFEIVHCYIYPFSLSTQMWVLIIYFQTYVRPSQLDRENVP